MKQPLAPVVLFVYNRLWHTQQTIKALQKNELAIDSDLFIFADGAKNVEDQSSVNDVRKYLTTITGFKTITIEKSLSNKGLANSIIYGVTKIINQFGTVIVLEDDMITSKYFLQYMNNNLTTYYSFGDIISIHGFVYPIKNLPETFFLRGADCWGWATWKRGWDLFEANGQKLLNAILEKKLAKEFDFNNTYPFTQMLRDQIAGKNSSWAIRWYASAFLANKLTLYPGNTLVKNIGFDNSGTHCGSDDVFKSTISELEPACYKIEAMEDLQAKARFENFFKSNRKVNILLKLKAKFKKLLNQ